MARQLTVIVGQDIALPFSVLPFSGVLQEAMAREVGSHRLLVAVTLVAGVFPILCPESGAADCSR
jgi:hypothetical protein